MLNKILIGIIIALLSTIAGGYIHIKSQDRAFEAVHNLLTISQLETAIANQNLNACKQEVAYVNEQIKAAEVDREHLHRSLEEIEEARQEGVAALAILYEQGLSCEQELSLLKAEIKESYYD